MTQRKLVVPEDASSERIDRYLARCLAKEFSRSQLKRWIDGGLVLLNGKVATPSAPVKAQDTIVVSIPPEAPSELIPEAIPLSIVHEDESLIVIDKPAGLVVHPGAGHTTGTLVHALLYHTSKLSAVAGALKPGIVHRLDKDTSGLMVIAKDDLSHRKLAKQFETRSIGRTYQALVDGRMRRRIGTIEAPLGRHPKDRKRFAVLPESQKAREAITEFRVVRLFDHVTWVELHPKTGRTHQLRVHLAHLGHPIVGDSRYGRTAHLKRQALHATDLTLIHPKSGKEMTFHSSLPEEIKEFIGGLG